jgi:hypothetical protein
VRHLALLLLLASPAAAEKKPAAKVGKPAPKQSATVKTLIEATMKKGAASTLDNPMAAQLGYAAPMSIRDFQVADTSKDTQLASVVVLSDGKPSELVLSSTTVTEWVNGAPISIDGYSFRADLSGNFIAAVRAYGKVGTISQDKVSGKAVEGFYSGLLKSILAQPSVRSR